MTPTFPPPPVRSRCRPCPPSWGPRGRARPGAPAGSCPRRAAARARGRRGPASTGSAFPGVRGVDEVSRMFSQNSLYPLPGDPWAGGPWRGRRARWRGRPRGDWRGAAGTPPAGAHSAAPRPPAAASSHSLVTRSRGHAISATDTEYGVKSIIYVDWDMKTEHCTESGRTPHTDGGSTHRLLRNM